MIFFAIFGFLLWLAATLVFRFGGSVLLDPGNMTLIVVLFAVVLAMRPVLIGLFKLRNVSRGERMHAAVSVAVPGMLLDMFSIAWYQTVFPGLTAEQLPLLCAWLFWAYAIMILSGLQRGKGRT
ncbi:MULTISPECIES: DUF5367 family protein [unclassified Paenibacillus]|uniref:DUF5367 family protein n=1 Tax=unclassified Paenibacillus TaxID=185978 RepID=UPI001C1281FC|nr:MULTISPECIES: DUF5367 family protein [unclassified Paenibacillus]MBU5444239.1 DUF5367 domain-containing protein [Paenibacillus sp. MSJ-34]CAH0120125.1 hypothetical protein PAE9249_02638 [Paenibacillus sp. CECT 9249]